MGYRTMRLLLLIGLIKIATVVPGNAGWDQQTCEERGNPAEAVSACTRLIEGTTLDDRDFTTALYNRGIHLSHLGEIERAIEDFSRVIQIRTVDRQAYNGRGNAYFLKGDLERAIQDYDAQIKIDPLHDNAYNGRGRAYAALGQFDRAIADYDKQIELNPQHSHAYNGRGRAYAALGQFDRAIADYDKQIEIDGQHHD